MASPACTDSNLLRTSIFTKKLPELLNEKAFPSFAGLLDFAGDGSLPNPRQVPSRYRRRGRQELLTAKMNRHRILIRSHLRSCLRKNVLWKHFEKRPHALRVGGLFFNV